MFNVRLTCHLNGLILTKKKKKGFLTLIERGSWMLLESGVGGWISPHLLDHLKTLWKTKKNFFDFLKVHNELGKVTKFWTSRPLFSWRNSHLKKGRADSAPPRTNKVKMRLQSQLQRNKHSRNLYEIKFEFKLWARNSNNMQQVMKIVFSHL